MRKFFSAQSLIEELGITEPNEIDIEAIAFYCGAIVKERLLQGCEARILGLDDKAIITVNSTSQLERKRFSIAHELGHWMRDRGRISMACEKQKMLGRGEANSETIANTFAAEILMPKAMFRKALNKNPMTFVTADILGGLFKTSRLATAIRMVELGPPAIIACYDKKGRKWFHSGPEVPYLLKPEPALIPESEAHDLLFKGKNTGRPTSVPADLWLGHPSSADHELVEHSISFRDSEIITILWWKDESQLESFQ